MTSVRRSGPDARIGVSSSNRSFCAHRERSVCRRRFIAVGICSNERARDDHGGTKPMAISLNRSRAVSWFRFSGALTLVVVASCVIVTHHHDNLRTGWIRDEALLTPALLKSGYFGLVAAPTPVDDQVDAEPLVVKDQEIDGKVRTVAYVATENNTVYAIDGATGAVLIKRSLGTPVPTDPTSCSNDYIGHVGIKSTPAIDWKNHALYVMAYVLDPAEGPGYYLHALDTASLEDKRNSPIRVSAEHRTDNSPVYFDARRERQRSALLFANAKVYAAFGSFCDAETSPGWLLAWDASSLDALPGNVLVNGKLHLGDIWMSGSGPAIDGTTTGDVYFVTGSGGRVKNKCDSDHQLQGPWYLHESVVRVTADLVQVVDAFTPKNWCGLDAADQDFGSGGVLIVPDQRGHNRHLLVAAGKAGQMYLLDRNDLSNAQHVSSVPIGKCNCGESYFEGNDGVGRIVSSGGNTVKVWRLDNSGSYPSLTLAGESPSLEPGSGAEGFFTTVSSNGATDSSAIIWALGEAYQKPDDHVTLYAYSAIPDADGRLALLWSGPAGSGVGARSDASANLVPNVSDGRVYVASNKQLQIFGHTTHCTATTTPPNTCGADSCGKTYDNCPPGAPCLDGRCSCQRHCPPNLCNISDGCGGICGCDSGLCENNGCVSQCNELCHAKDCKQAKKACRGGKGVCSAYEECVKCNCLPPAKTRRRR